MTMWRGCFINSKIDLWIYSLILILIVTEQLGSIAAVTFDSGGVGKFSRLVAAAGSSVVLDCGKSESSCLHRWTFVSEPYENLFYTRDAIDLNLSDLRSRNWANIELLHNNPVKINHVASNNAGNYTCSVFCDANLTAQRTWKLSVKNATIQLLHDKENWASSGSSLLLECLTTNRSGERFSNLIGVAWTKDGTPIDQLEDFNQRVLVPTYSIDYERHLSTIRSDSSLPKFVLSLNGKLLIRNLSESDQGVYACSREGHSSSSGFELDFALIRLINTSTERLAVDVRAVTDQELLINRSRLPINSDGSASQCDLSQAFEDSCMIAQRFYLHSLSGSATVVENADAYSQPSRLSAVESITLRQSVAKKRKEFLAKLNGGSSSQYEKVAKSFADSTVNTSTPDMAWSELNLGMRLQYNFAIETQGTRSSSSPDELLATCHRSVPQSSSNVCGCTLEQSYELRIAFMVPDNIINLSDCPHLLPARTAHSVLFRVLVTLHNQTDCARLRAALPSFTSLRRADPSVPPPPPPPPPLPPQPHHVPSRPNVSNDNQQDTLQPLGEIDDKADDRGDMQHHLLVAAMVICAVIVLAVVLFVAMLLARARSRLANVTRCSKPLPDANDAHLRRTSSTTDANARRLLYASNMYARPAVELQQLVPPEDALTRGFDDLVNMPYCQSFALVIDPRTDSERRVDAHTLELGDIDVHGTAHGGDDTADHDSSSASASSGGATTNTSCFCSTNVSLDSRELLGVSDTAATHSTCTHV